MNSIYLTRLFSVQSFWPVFVRQVYSFVVRFHSINSYGLFAVMTVKRPEIIIEGSNDGVHWLQYEFKYKPDKLNEPPPFIAPHQPRLDWQMWFAALSTFRKNPWFINLCVSLLQDSKEVIRLLKHNPFPDSPPKYLRAIIYEYKFTSLKMKEKTGRWWKRKYLGVYFPAVRLNGKNLEIVQ